MRSTGLQSRRCAMRTTTLTLSGSKSKFTTTSGSFGCGFGTMEKASAKKFWVREAAPDIMACQACRNAALVNGKLSILSGPNLRGQGGADDSGGHRLSKTGWRQIRRLNPYRSKP